MRTLLFRIPSGHFSARLLLIFMRILFNILTFRRVYCCCDHELKLMQILRSDLVLVENQPEVRTIPAGWYRAQLKCYRYQDRSSSK